MSNQISLTIPNDDPIALRAFGNALEEMAVAHGASLRLRPSIDPNMFAGRSGIIQPLTDNTDQEAPAVLDDFTHKPDIDEDVEADGLRGNVAQHSERPDAQPSFPASDLDADGLPWDARIHSGNQERNADNTWRARRKPKDLTSEQWEEQVAQVRDELFALMAIPVADPAPQCRDCDDTGKFYAMDDTPCACPAGDVYRTETESPAAVFGTLPPVPESIPVAEIVTVSEHPVVVEQSSGGLSLGFNIQCEPLPAPPIADPVPPAPPVVAADTLPPVPAPIPTATAAAGVPATLAELMTWLTKKAPSDDAGRAARLEQINGIVARHGLVTLGQLQKRLDLIPQVYADLVKELGV